VNACALAAHEKAMWVKAHIAFLRHERSAG